MWNDGNLISASTSHSRTYKNNRQFLECFRPVWGSTFWLYPFPMKSTRFKSFTSFQIDSQLDTDGFVAVTITIGTPRSFNWRSTLRVRSSSRITRDGALRVRSKSNAMIVLASSKLSSSHCNIFGSPSYRKKKEVIHKLRIHDFEDFEHPFPWFDKLTTYIN